MEAAACFPGSWSVKAFPGASNASIHEVLTFLQRRWNVSRKFPRLLTPLSIRSVQHARLEVTVILQVC